MAPNRRLKQARELRGWSQARMAEMIGTDATTVSRWERGLFVPTPHFREKLCECFGKNAEELGLLDSMTEPHLQGVLGPSGESDAHDGSGLASQAGTMGRGEMITLKPRLSPDGVDTFTYILQRSSQEQQAYMLWEHAYVQALQDQPAEAQRLGQASVNVFEQVRHPNAAVVRAWLHQQGLLSGSSSSSADPSRPSDIQRKRAARPWLRVGGASVFVMLVLVAGLLLSGITANRAGPSASGDVKYSPMAFGGNNPSKTPAPHIDVTPSAISERPHAIQVVNKGHMLQSPSLTPVPSPTPIPTPSPQQSSAPSSGGTNDPSASSGSAGDPSIMPTITPTNLNPHTCTMDGGGYRCTITLAVYANTHENFSWQASSTGIATKINSLTGTLTTGSSFQDIVYIYTPCSQHGTLSFGFHAPSSTRTTTVSTSWTC